LPIISEQSFLEDIYMADSGEQLFKAVTGNPLNPDVDTANKLLVEADGACKARIHI
jgi:hypothetical protein